MSAHKMPHAAVSWSPEQLSPAIVCVCVGVCGWVCEYICMYVFTVRVINGCKRSFSPRYCANPRTNKGKGQIMKRSFMAIADFLENTLKFHLLYLSLWASLYVCMHRYRCESEWAWRWFSGWGEGLSCKQKVVSIISRIFQQMPLSEGQKLYSWSVSLD